MMRAEKLRAKISHCMTGFLLVEERLFLICSFSISKRGEAMKKFTFICTLFVILQSSGNVFADKYNDAMQEILSEKNILDASWGPYKGSSLYVSVKDDGTRRDGLAQYLCLILKDYGISSVSIHVMNPVDMKNFDTDKDLGRHICK